MTNNTTKTTNQARQESLDIAVGLGADEKTLAALRAASRLSRGSTIVLPARYAGLSRATGWARCGRGSDARWGEKASGGYRVGPGRWTVYSSDGYRREDRTEWTVRHVAVGTATWTVAD